MLKTETLRLKARKNLGHFYVSSILTLYWNRTCSSNMIICICRFAPGKCTIQNVV